MVENFGVREKKTAQLRVSILEEMLRLLKTKNLSSILIDDLCYNLNTTKVTFFKYFNYKEQVLDYFVCRWLYERSFDIHRKKYKGEEGLYNVFKSICEDEILGKKIMVSLVNYYSKLTEKPAAINPTSYEYFLFNEEAFKQNVKPMDLREIFVHYLSDIKDIPPSRFNDLVCQLLALMYGVPIQTHIMELNDMYPFYEIGIRSIIEKN